MAEKRTFGVFSVRTPHADGSLHAALPPEIVEEAIEKGWAEQHPVARMGYIPRNVVMIYAPRDAEEVEVIAGLWSWRPTNTPEATNLVARDMLGASLKH